MAGPVRPKQSLKAARHEEHERGPTPFSTRAEMAAHAARRRVRLGDTPDMAFVQWRDRQTTDSNN
jgi:hypothetical protein